MNQYEKFRKQNMARAYLMLYQQFLQNGFTKEKAVIKIIEVFLQLPENTLN
jgi:hypothetical protein